MPFYRSLPDRSRCRSWKLLVLLSFFSYVLSCAIERIFQSMARKNTVSHEIIIIIIFITRPTRSAFAAPWPSRPARPSSWTPPSTLATWQGGSSPWRWQSWYKIFKVNKRTKKNPLFIPLKKREIARLREIFLMQCSIACCCSGFFWRAHLATRFLKYNN